MLARSFLLLAVAISGVVSEEIFGMRLTTEKLKTREDTQYLFRYYVKDDTTGDYKTQEETKEGDSVQGSYTIAEPNGDLRTVTYKAGPGRGFEAKVDVQPSKFHMKHTSEAPTSGDETSTSVKDITQSKMDSSVKHFPGGFTMDISSKPQSETKTEIGVKFSMKPNASTEEVTEAVTSTQANTTEPLEKISSRDPVQTKTETTSSEAPQELSSETTQELSSETTQELSSETTQELNSETTQAFEVENTTFLGEGRDISEDPIEKEISDAINSMPKLPELVLSDNKTHFKFHKDPEEALLDERITQIARQLAETSLRREYEERKLGHFIPISVRPIGPSTSGYLSKSFKFGNDVPNLRPTDNAPVQVLTQVRVVPQYIYRETLLPKYSPVQHRLPVITKPKPEIMASSQTISNVPETITEKRKNHLREINKILKIGSNDYETTILEPASMMPSHVPTFLHFFSPFQRYFMETQRTFVPNTPPNLYVGSISEDLTTGTIPLNDDSTFYSHVSTADDQSTENTEMLNVQSIEKS